MSERPGARPAVWVVFAVALLAQLVVLYAPSSPGEAPFLHSDKVVHLLVFLVPVAAALLAGLALRPVVAAFVAHAVVSEVVQGLLLPTRAGDVLDVVADLSGIALGVGLWWVVVRPRAAALAD